MTHSIDEITSSIWSAIQRVSPSVTREEISGILRVALDAPTADEGPILSPPSPIGVDHPYWILGKQWKLEEMGKLKAGQASINKNYIEKHYIDRIAANRQFPEIYADGYENS